MPKKTSKKNDTLTAGGRHRYLHMIGVISLQWNGVEDALEVLIATYMEMANVDRKLSYHLTATMGNQSRTDLLIWLVEQYEKDRRAIEVIRHAIKATHICRENRNILLHSRAHRLIDVTRFEFARRSKTNPQNMVIHALTLPQIKLMHQAIFKTESLLRKIAHYVWIVFLRRTTVFPNYSKDYPHYANPSLPRKFALPRKLTALPLVNQLKLRPQKK